MNMHIFYEYIWKSVHSFSMIANNSEHEEFESAKSTV